ncbi:hypothetical protein ACVWZV_001134 [Bradyrhizobium sp. GM5.1]
MDAWTVLSASHVKLLSSTWRTRSGQFVDCERLPDQFHPRVNHPVWTTASACGPTYDLVYAADLTTERLKEFERDLV